jgi:hypothetical protein
MQDDEAETYDVSLLPKEVLSVIEADSFWCLSKLLDGIQVSVTAYIQLLCYCRGLARGRSGLWWE